MQGQPLKLGKKPFTRTRTRARRLAGLITGLMLLYAGVIAGARSLPANAGEGSNQVFELRIYHAVPGKLPALEARFRDKTSKLLARHNLNVVGYWVTEEASENSFVFLLAHKSRDEARKNWEAFRLDPELQELAKSEQADKTLERAEIIWLRPTDFSPMK